MPQWAILAGLSGAAAGSIAADSGSGLIGWAAIITAAGGVIIGILGLVLRRSDPSQITVVVDRDGNVITRTEETPPK